MKRDLPFVLHFPTSRQRYPRKRHITLSGDGKRDDVRTHRTGVLNCDFENIRSNGTLILYDHTDGHLDTVLCIHSCRARSFKLCHYEIGLAQGLALGPGLEGLRIQTVKGL